MAFSRSVSIVTAINVVGSALSIVNVSLMAHYFGTSESIEIYFAATLLLTTLLAMANSGQISDIVLPIYHQITHQHSYAAGHLAYAVMTNWAVLISLALVITLYFVLPYAVQILVPGFSTAAQAKVVGAMYWILPLLLFSILVQFCTTFINAESQFGRPELIALCVKLISLACIVLLAEKYDYWALIIGLWASMAFRVAGYFTIIYRLGYRHKFVLLNESIHFSTIARQFISSSGYALSSQIFQITLNAGISQLPQGTFAIYTYVRQLSEKTSGIFLRPISLVFFTNASHIISKGVGDLRVLCEQALGLFSLSAIPVLIYMLIYGDLFLAVLLGSNSITSEQIAAGGIILQVLFGLLLIAGLSNIYRKILLSSGWAEQLYWSASVVQLIAAGIALLLLPAFGVQGIVAAIAANSMLNAVWLMVLVKLKNGQFYFYNPRKLFAWLLVGIAVSISAHFMLDFTHRALDTASRLESALYLSVHSLLFGILVFTAGLLFRVQEMKWVYDNIASRAVDLARQVKRIV